ncbi:hypothetical protein C8R44DRAFT_988194 [Mycena epipterygia]|nr:hypothetical protein C8R44DRAFT_988188 [Mycena epipterygia]KAJ7102867.1 hypothetical protein C8R44DRAFT_988194 [Mycena epipterygia]
MRGLRCLLKLLRPSDTAARARKQRPRMPRSHKRSGKERLVLFARLRMSREEESASHSTMERSSLLAGSGILSVSAAVFSLCIGPTTDSISISTDLIQHGAT